MKFLPFDNFKIYSSLSYDEVRQVLDEEVEPRKGFMLSGIFNTSDKPFRGEVFENTFKIFRNIRYKNSFLPIIKGKVSDNYPGTVIEINMRMVIFVYIFMAVWITGVSAALIFTLREAFVASIIPLAMLVFAYLVMIVAYRYEAGKAKKFLNEIFKAQVGEDGYDVQDPINTYIDEKIKGL
jgi:hypothetical protein